MNNTNNNNKKSIGFKGEMYVIDKLKTKGFLLYNKNIKSINSEIDIVVYRYDSIKYTLDIRIVEVKTRWNYEFELTYFNLDKKWRLIRPHIFKIKSEIESKFDVLNYSEIHFDLALVRYNKDLYNLYSYIKDINLML
jgi:Holliday junction resolvase-like predicted endonuclease